MSDLVLSPEFQERERACEIAYRRGFHHGARAAENVLRMGQYDQFERAKWFRQWLDKVQAWREAFSRGEESDRTPPEA
jgi:hypothetical protein